MMKAEEDDDGDDPINGGDKKVIQDYSESKRYIFIGLLHIKKML